MNEEVAIVLTVAVAVAGGVTLIVAAMNNRRRLREMHHRERLAMIQSGLLPAPELDPGRFEAATGLAPQPVRRGEKFRTAGIGLIGFGLALIMLIGGAAGELGIGIGVGGAWAILGGALLANYFLIRSEATDQSTNWTPPPPPRRPDPPSNIAP